MIQGKTGSWLFLFPPKTGSTSIREVLKKNGGQQIRNQHLTCAETGISLHKYDLRACVIRNTYSRAVSVWSHFTGMTESFEDYLRAMVSRNRPNDRIMVKPQLAWANECNFLLRFETLQKDFDMFCEQAGMDPVALPKLNQGKYKKTRDHRQYYTPELRRMVEDIWAQDIEHFGHTFDHIDEK